MADKPENPARRKALTIATALVGGIGIGATAVPFVQAMLPSAKARAIGADVEVDISGLEPGKLMIVKWRGQPVWVLRRTPEMLKDIDALKDKLKDPDSEMSVQPENSKNSYRSIYSEYLVVLGVCTHLACSPTFRPEHKYHEAGDWWRGGFFCPCHQSEYDLAGRVFKGRSPAPLNLPVPPHRFVGENFIRIGDESNQHT